MIDNAAVELSRLQFGLTAMYHFLFVPLTLGLSVLLGIMESVYVMTGRTIWRDMTKYWGLLFGINFAIGGVMAFFLEASFVGLFFFGWDRLSRIGHLSATWLLALGTNLSALWIL